MPARRKLATSRSSWLAIQNLWLQGEARPIELSTLVANGTVDQAAYKALPPAPSGDVTFPTQS